MEQWEGTSWEEEKPEAEAVLPLSELWKQMTEIVKGVVKGENEESGDTVQQTGATSQVLDLKGCISTKGKGKQDNNHKRDIHIREMGQRRRHHHPSD